MSDLLDDLDDPEYGGAQTVRVERKEKAMSDESRRVPLESVPVGRRVRVHPEGYEGEVTQRESRALWLDGHLWISYRNHTAEILPDPPVAAEPRILDCPRCGRRHVDIEEWATRPHKTHLCLFADCGHLWRPEDFPTVGIASPSPTFDQAWAVKVAEGYQYNGDALENVRFGWEIRESYIAQPAPDPRDAEIARLTACAVSLSDHVIALVREADEARERDRRNAAEIDKLRERLAYFDRQAAQHDATGRMAGHAEQCGCHGCATGPLRVEVERLTGERAALMHVAYNKMAEAKRVREALAKYGQHTPQCALRRRGAGGAAVRFPECTCGLADALKERP